MRKLMTVLGMLGALAFGTPDTAKGQLVVSGGLVNVTLVDVVDVGDVDVTVLENVGIGVAANVAAQICGLQVGNIGIIARLVAQQGQYTVCTIPDQNGDLQNVIISR